MLLAHFIKSYRTRPPKDPVLFSSQSRGLLTDLQQAVEEQRKAVKTLESTLPPKSAPPKGGNER